MDKDKNLQPVTLQLVQANHEDDEISLYDIWCTLLNYKYHITAITFVCTIAAVVYGLSLPPLYQAEAYLLPPNERDIIILSKIDSDRDNSSYSIENVFQKYINTFNSRSVRLHFFKKNNLLSKLTGKDESDVDKNEVFEKDFQELLIIEKSSANINKEAMRVKLWSSQAESSAEWLNKFVDFANHMTIKSLLENIEENILSEKKSIESEIINLRITAAQRKEDEIIVLSEALDTAKKMGLENSSDSSGYGAGLVNGQSTNLIISLQEKPVYSKGVIALSAELEIIEKRKDLDSYIPNLRELEAKIRILDVRLSWLKNDSSVKTVIVDQKAVTPKKRIKPKRKLIVVIGLLVGLITGIFTAFILNYSNKTRDQRS